MLSEYLKDVEGKCSSKRKWGGILISLGILIGTAAAVVSFFHSVANESLIVKVMDTFMIGGCGLLIGTLGERFQVTPKK